MQTVSFHLTLKSSNAKTGPIPVSTSGNQTCPDACPFKRGGGCYAESGPLALHWAKISGGTRGGQWHEFLSAIHDLPAGTFWRHNQAGDLPGENDHVDAGALSELVKANAGKRGFTFTHKPTTRGNLSAIKNATRSGFTVNLSGNNLPHADMLSRHGLPVVTVLPADAVNVRNLTTPEGRKVVVCPATRSKGAITCATCKLCQKHDRGFIIGFPAHGSGAGKVSKIARELTA